MCEKQVKMAHLFGARQVWQTLSANWHDILDNLSKVPADIVNIKCIIGLLCRSVPRSGLAANPIQNGLYNSRNGPTKLILWDEFDVLLPIATSHRVSPRSKEC